MPPFAIPDLTARWLLDPTAAESAQTYPAATSLQRAPLPIPPEVGEAWFDRLPLADGLSLIHAVCRFRPEANGLLLPMGEFEMDFPEPVFGAQVVQVGTVCHREQHPEAELIFKPGQDFFRHARRFHTIPLIDSSSDNEMTSLLISMPVLTELIGDDLAPRLIERLGLLAPPAVRVLPMPLQVSAPLRACMSSALQGPLQRLYAQSKVLEYLSALAAHVTGPVSMSCRQTRKRALAQDLHEELSHLEGKLPTLDELALRYGLSARRLNEEFAREYGLPIFAYISDQRLSEARHAIVTSDVPLKQLAARLGYSHVNHFSIAFKKKFGVAPGSLRKPHPQKSGAHTMAALETH